MKPQFSIFKINFVEIIKKKNKYQVVDLKACLYQRVKEKEGRGLGEIENENSHFLIPSPKWQQKPKIGQVEPKSQEHHLGLPCGWYGTMYFGQ